ncbi:MAG: FAD-binding oxidoreductase, partial [Deltaproteobacteria bacterium]|nr:FAD-binding oxidoreductase [Deltaproteobacteria bacterium]
MTKADRTYDVIIIGGGMMGSATAYYLMKADPALKVAVVERDAAYTQASTTLSMANVRIQFSLKENVQISLYTQEVLKSFEEDMAIEDQKPKIYYRREGNLFLVDAAGEAAARRAFDMQKDLGCHVQWWSPQEIKQHFQLYDPAKFVAGTFSPDDGYMDAYAVLMGYKAKSR